MSTELGDGNLAMEINEIFERLERFLYPVHAKVTQAFKHAKVHSFVICFGVYQLINFYEKFFTQQDLQKYFLKIPVLSIRFLFYITQENVESFFHELFFKNQDEAIAMAQMRKFLTKRQENKNQNKDFHYYYAHKGQCVISFVKYVKKHHKQDSEGHNVLEINNKYFSNMARQVGLSENQINIFSCRSYSRYNFLANTKFFTINMQK